MNRKSAENRGETANFTKNAKNGDGKETERPICVNLRSFAVSLGVKTIFGRKWAPRRGIYAGKQEICMKTGGGTGSYRVFLLFPVFLLIRGFGGSGGPTNLIFDRPDLF
jgi:hypothetical protein